MIYILKKLNDTGTYVDSENKRCNLIEGEEGVDFYPGLTFKNTGPKTIEEAIIYYGVSLFVEDEESSEEIIEPVQVFAISKYLLVKNLMAIGKDDDFYLFLENPANVKIKRLWDTAQILMSDDEFVVSMKPVVMQTLGLTENEVNSILEASKG